MPRTSAPIAGYLDLRRASQPTVATLHGLPPGDDATYTTLRIMRQYVREAIRDPNQFLREFALSLVADLPARNWLAEVDALHSFVKNEIRYVQDPVGLELVATPLKTLDYAQGDCDDKSTLLAALLESIGHPAQFVAVGIQGGPFSHVLVETKIGENWVPLETIIDKPRGWFPPDATSAYRLSAS